MTDKIKALFIKHREIILYLIFGGLTTLVNLVVYYSVLYIYDIHYLVAEVSAWIAAVAFAFVTNKLFVFGDNNAEKKTLLRQLVQFVGVRLSSGAIEVGLLWLLVDVVSIDEGIAKIPVAILPVVINYVASKLFIFKKK